MRSGCSSRRRPRCWPAEPRSARGGHTARPHLSGDLVHALGLIITQTPALLARRVDPRAGVNLTWGRVSAGTADNAIPARGVVSGTLRCLDANAWDEAGRLVRSEEHTSELQSRGHLVCRLLLEKKK